MTATFRFYAELNDFLDRNKRQVAFSHSFFGRPSVKEVIEAIGVPHTEIDLILIDGVSSTFDDHLQGGERIAVYPVCESLELKGVTRLRPHPLRTPRFILDVHLGKLARYLRLLGFDTLYEKNYSDTEIIDKGTKQSRIILTRDLGILKQTRVVRGYFLRNTRPKKQIEEVMRRFALDKKAKPFTRCLECNTPIAKVAKEAITERLLPETRRYFESFEECPRCHRIYWQGSHYDKLKHFVESIIRL